MSNDDSEWMSADEAIAHIMRTTGCSRRAARKKLARHVKNGQIGSKSFRAVAKDLAPSLPPTEAADRFADDPASIYINLAEFLIKFNLTVDELLGELRSGRLRAHAINESAFLGKELGALDFGNFGVGGDDLLAWTQNPKTPPHVIAKVKTIHPRH
jgi:hypothetical protein